MEKYLLLTEEEIKEFINLPGYRNNIHKVPNFRKINESIYFVNESWMNEKENLEIEVGNSYLLENDEIIVVTDKVSDNDYKILDFMSDPNINSLFSIETISVNEFNTFVIKKLDKEFSDRIKLLHEKYVSFLNDLQTLISSIKNN